MLPSSGTDAADIRTQLLEVARAGMQQTHHFQKEQINAIVASLVHGINGLGDILPLDRWGRAPNIRVRCISWPTSSRVGFGWIQALLCGRIPKRQMYDIAC